MKIWFYLITIFTCVLIVSFYYIASNIKYSIESIHKGSVSLIKSVLIIVGALLYEQIQANIWSLITHGEEFKATKEVAKNVKLEILFFYENSIIVPILEEVMNRAIPFIVCLWVLYHIFKFFKKTVTVSDVYKISLVIYLIISSVIFSLLHSHDNWLSFLIYTLSGFVWAIAYVWSKTLVVPIAIHIINNAVSSLGTIYPKYINIDASISNAIIESILLLVLISSLIILEKKGSNKHS
ncbi:MAG: CPBP family intramembrane glutamic endopeptidase [Dermabacter sp.]|nr:CPBP family intramembrane glutamic endopeptidase [Dermabacter sp.]